MNILRGLLTFSFFLAFCAKPLPPPPAVPKHVDSEVDAKAALEKAAATNTPDAFFDVYHQYGQFPSGKEAMKRGAKLVFEQARNAADKCDHPAARGLLSSVAAFTSDDEEINAAYDEITRNLVETDARCEVVHVDTRIKELSAVGDFASAFDLIEKSHLADIEKEKRRASYLKQWRKYLDVHIRQVVDGKWRPSPEERTKLEASVDPAQLPAAMLEEAGRWQTAVQSALTIFVDLQGGTLLAPPKYLWVNQVAHSHRVESPRSATGPLIDHASRFLAVASAKNDGETLYLAVFGPVGADVVTRFQNARFLISETETKPFDTSRLPH